MLSPPYFHLHTRRKLRASDCTSSQLVSSYVIPNSISGLVAPQISARARASWEVHLELHPPRPLESATSEPVFSIDLVAFQVSTPPDETHRP